MTTYFMPEIVLGFGDTVVNKTEKIPALSDLRDKWLVFSSHVVYRLGLK